MSKIVTRKFSKEFLQEMMGGGWPGTPGDKPPYDKPCKLVREKIVSQGRWETEREYVFEYEGNLYTIYHSSGSTEQQDYDGWSYEDGPFCVAQVRPVETLTIEYQPVREGVTAEG